MDRNLLNLYESLPKQGTFRSGQPYAMPVESNDRIKDRDVAFTSRKGGGRMTMTYPILNRAGRVVWAATVKDKAEKVNRVLDGDESIPVGRIRRARALRLADQAAAGSTSHVKGWGQVP